MKLRRALAVLVLLAFAVIPVMADPAVVTGDIYTNFITDLGVTSAVAGVTQVTGVGYYGYTNLYVKAAVSPWINTVYWLYFYVGNKNQDLVIGTTVPDTKWFQFPSIIEADATIDLTKPFGIDPAQLDNVLKMGFYGSWDNAYCNMTAGGYEDVSIAGVGHTGGGYDWYMSNLLTVAKDFNFKFAIAPRSAWPAVDMFVGAYATPNLGFGTLRAELFYDTALRSDWMGQVQANGRIEIPMGTDGSAVWAGAGFLYDLNPTLNTATTQQWKFAVTGKYLMGTLVNVAASLWGNSLDIVDGASYTVYVTPIVTLMDGKGADGKVDASKVVTIDLCASGKLSFESNTVRSVAAKQLIQGLDTAARVNIGNADIYLGYLFTNVAAGAIWGPNATGVQGSTAMPALTNGGLYVRYYQPF